MRTGSRRPRATVHPLRAAFHPLWAAFHSLRPLRAMVDPVPAPDRVPLVAAGRIEPPAPPVRTALGAEQVGPVVRTDLPVPVLLREQPAVGAPPGSRPPGCARAVYPLAPHPAAVPAVSVRVPPVGMAVGRGAPAFTRGRSGAGAPAVARAEVPIADAVPVQVTWAVPVRGAVQAVWPNGVLRHDGGSSGRYRGPTGRAAVRGAEGARVTGVALAGEEGLPFAGRLDRPGRLRRLTPSVGVAPVHRRLPPNWCPAEWLPARLTSRWSRYGAPRGRLRGSWR